jgi:glycosyltransferase involved in cell wall biosynthesis
MQGRFDFTMAARLAAFIKRHGAQVVHAHKGREQALAFWASCFTHIPALVANRGVSFPVGRLRALKYRYRTDAVVAVSESVRQELLASGVPAAKLVTIHGGVDIERFQPGIDGEGVREELNIPPQALVIAKVAHVREWKGYDIFLRAAAIVAAAEPRAIFVGVGKGTGETPALEHLARELHLSDRVRWTGFREDLPQLLAAADLCVHAATAGHGQAGGRDRRRRQSGTGHRRQDGSAGTAPHSGVPGRGYLDPHPSPRAGSGPGMGRSAYGRKPFLPRRQS